MITFTNLAETFRAPAAENPFALSPHGILESVGLMTATQILHLVPDGPSQQCALGLLRLALDMAEGAVPPENREDADKAMAKTLAPFVATPLPVVRQMLEMATIGPKDVVYDLGCGDGRIVIEAARIYGCRAVGVDVDEQLLDVARETAKSAGVGHLVEFANMDALEADVSEATVVTLYLLSVSNLRLRDKLRSQLRPGARIVSHAFTMGDWAPNEEVHGTTPEGRECKLYLWKV